MTDFITFAEAMASQPAVLAELEARLDGELAEFPSGVEPWRTGETVALLAMGAAHHSTHALARALRSGGIRALDIPASDVEGVDVRSLGDHALVVSESGRSPEPIAAARRFPTGRRLVITNDADAPVSEVADALVSLGGFVDSRAYTVGFTATLVAFDRLARALGMPHSGDRSISSAVAASLQAFAEPAAALGENLALASSVDVIGSASSYAAAAEIALLIRECLRIPASAYETQQYLHGPRESLGPGTTVIVVGDGRERVIPAAMEGSGAGFVVIGRDLGDGAPLQFDVGNSAGFSRVAVEVVAGQLLMAAAIGHLPFEIDEFVHGQSDTKV
ncbi:glucosamine--fructose-6-phosphate aminotransferase [Humibacter soli]